MSKEKSYTFHHKFQQLVDNYNNKKLMIYGIVYEGSTSFCSIRGLTISRILSENWLAIWSKEFAAAFLTSWIVHT